MPKSDKAQLRNAQVVLQIMGYQEFVAQGVVRRVELEPNCKVCLQKIRKVFGVLGKSQESVYGWHIVQAFQMFSDRHVGHQGPAK